MTTSEYTTVFDDLVSEITQHYYRGRILVAIDGVDGDVSDQFAESLAAAMRARSWSVVQASSASDTKRGGQGFSFPRHDKYQADDDYSVLMDIVSQFRDRRLNMDTSAAAIPVDAMLIVSGGFLLRPELRALWHFRVWLEGDLVLNGEFLEAQVRYTRDRAPRGAADAIFQVTEGKAPARVWADSC